MESVATREGLASMPCLVVFLLSCGEKHGITGSDGDVFNLDNMFLNFSNDKCLHLKGKPKLFIIDGWRAGRCQ